MKSKRLVYLGVVVAGIAAFLASWPSQLSSQQGTSVSIDNDDIGGVVTSAKGPEAGVWVIAETTDLPTRFAKMVVTDDQGRYVLPDLPKANYNIWVRGYGLVDSPKVKAAPGKILNLKAVVAPNDAAAAKYYPAIYWYSMMKIPEASEFGGKGKIPEKLTQNEYLNLMKSNGCANCHSHGRARHAHLSCRRAVSLWASSPIPKRRGFAASSRDKAAYPCSRRLSKSSAPQPFPYFADWTDRIAKGELPHAKPPRPQGVERNIVVTTWDWLDDKHYLHDLIASDRRYPTVNAYGPVYGSTELSIDVIPILDPKTHTAKNFRTPVRDAGYACRSGRKADAAVALLGQRTDLDEQGEQPQRHVRSVTDACGSRRRCAVRTIRPSARRARTILRPKPFRWSARTAILRCSIPRRRSTRSSTPASGRIICSSMPTTDCGPAAAVRSSAGST